VLVGAAGFVAHAALTGSRTPSAAAGAQLPEPGLLDAAATQVEAASAAPGVAARTSCADSDCACRRRQALESLEAGAAEATQWLASFEMEAQGACADGLLGVRAEALARANRCAEARAVAIPLANRGLGEADYALAMCAYRAGDRDLARSSARAAIAHGRAALGHLVLGMIALEASEQDVAEAELTQAVQLAPKLADAHYNLGVLLHRTGRYNRARAAYLAALGAEPRYRDARHQLVLLTAQAGALLEARHHLEKLREVLSPGDERLEGAEARVRELSASGAEALTLPGSR
jgi:tetratricopeptide (TPR) repeat protein